MRRETKYKYGRDLLFEWDVCRFSISSFSPPSFLTLHVNSNIPSFIFCNIWVQVQCSWFQFRRGWRECGWWLMESFCLTLLFTAFRGSLEVILNKIVVILAECCRSRYWHRFCVLLCRSTSRRFLSRYTVMFFGFLCRLSLVDMLPRCFSTCYGPYVAPVDAPPYWLLSNVTVCFALRYPYHLFRAIVHASGLFLYIFLCTDSIDFFGFCCCCDLWVLS